MKDDLLPSLASTVDYIRGEVTEQADTFDFDEAVALRDACLKVAEEAKTAAGLIETTMIGQLEAGVRQIDNRLFKRKRERVKRFRHDLIDAAVTRHARAAATDDDGVMSVTKAMDTVVQAMRNLYVSPSTPAKVGALDALKIERKDVTEYEDRGWRLSVEVLDDRQD